MPAARSREPERIYLSPSNPDPLASLRLWSVVVELGGKEFTVPSLPAARWLEILMAPTSELNPEDWFPGFAGPQAVMDVNNMLIDGVISQDEVVAVIWDVLEAMSGRRWWITLRLCASARAHWEWLGGELALAGVSPFDMPLGFWLDGVYAAMVKGIAERASKPQLVADWTRMLTAPPAQSRREFDEKANADAFLAALRGAR